MHVRCSLFLCSVMASESSQTFPFLGRMWVISGILRTALKATGKGQGAGI